MIIRLALSLIRELAEQFPAVLILGPRQCGKTTLARRFLSGDYYDLEKPSDRQIFLGDIEPALRNMGRPLIIDEAQTLPELFPVLRSIIDEQRNPGRFYLLGSVNPALIRHISESLAGRVGIVELTPFLYPEAKKCALNLPAVWLKGGFPNACQTSSPVQWTRWLEAYVQTFVERDMARYGLKNSPFDIRRFMVMTANLHGGLLNTSDLGRSMGVTYHTIRHYLDILEAHYLVRRLAPFHANLGKRLVKMHKIYIRDSGLLHHLLGIGSERALLESPRRGASWEGWVIEQLISMELLHKSGSQFFFYRTSAGAEIDLLIIRGADKIGFEIKSAQSAHPRDWTTLAAERASGIITRGYVVYMGKCRYPAAEGIEAIGAEEIIMKAAIGRI